MNKPQKALVLAGLVSVAIVLHVWHFDYGTRTTQQPSARHGELELLWWSWTSEEDERDFAYRVGEKARWLSLTPEQKKLELREREERLAKLSAEVRFGLQRTPYNPGEWNPVLRSRRWVLYLRSVENDENVLWGAIAPAAVFGVAAFLILGWRRPRTQG